MTKVPYSTGQTLTALCSAVESCGVVPTTEACVDLWEVGREEGGKEGGEKKGGEKKGGEKKGGEKKGGEKKGGEKKGGEKKGGEKKGGEKKGGEKKGGEKKGGEKKGGEKKGGEKKGGEKKGVEEGKYKVHIECLLCAQSLFPNYTFVLPENEATVRSLGQLLAAVAVQG